MPIRPSIDDTNTTLIEYQGDWQAMLGGSSRQWESSVHATIQPGASATFRFIGEDCDCYFIFTFGSW